MKRAGVALGCLLCLLLIVLVSRGYRGKEVDLTPVAVPEETARALQMSKCNYGSFEIEYASEIGEGYLIWYSYELEGRKHYMATRSSGQHFFDTQNAALDYASSHFSIVHSVDARSIPPYSRGRAIFGFVYADGVDRLQVVSNDGSWVIKVYEGRFAGILEGGVTDLTTLKGLDENGDVVFSYQPPDIGGDGQKTVLGAETVQGRIIKGLMVAIALALAYISVKTITRPKGAAEAQCLSCRHALPYEGHLSTVNSVTCRQGIDVNKLPVSQRCDFYEARDTGH